MRNNKCPQAEREKLEGQFLASFPGFADEIKSSGRLSHEELRALRSDIALLSTPDLYRYVPQVLLDLLQEHADDLFDREGIFFVVSLLDVEPNSDFSDLRELLGNDLMDVSAAESGFLGEAKNAALKDFSVEQSRSLVTWLDLALKMQLFDHWHKELSSALNYWKRRAKHQRGRE